MAVEKFEIWRDAVKIFERSGREGKQGEKVKWCRVEQWVSLLRAPDNEEDDDDAIKDRVE
jgi:hypothetical protein